MSSAYKLVKRIGGNAAFPLHAKEPAHPNCFAIVHGQVDQWFFEIRIPLVFPFEVRSIQGQVGTP